MAVRQFLQCTRTASPSELAEAAGALARAFLNGDLPEPEREDARLALTGLLDDSSPLVRRALAESFACAANVPHYMVQTLANDSSDVAAIVLARSPLLSDTELVECAATADAFAQSAIALRPFVSAPVAAALAEVGSRDALISLAANPGAELLEFSVRRMIERYGDDPDLRAALLARPSLAASLRSDLAGAAAKALAARVTGRAGLTPERARCLTREAREKANVKIAAETAGDASEILKFVAHLRRSGQLTAGLLLRALLCGNKHLLETALCELSGLAMPRVMGLVAESKSAGFAALYRKAHMPERLLPAFIAGLDAVAKSRCGGPMNACLQGPIVASVLHACASVNHGELDQLIAALRRLEAEAARNEAREIRRATAASHASPDLAR
ncbi:MAG TPA: DUF2336 domain-containing protein, partial [Methylocella sp.]|nr:DUF2336 domain-containing protein [Methylocella sp.]